MRSFAVVFVTIPVQAYTGLRNRAKHKSIQTFIAHCAVEPFLLSILPRLAWLNVECLHAAIPKPELNGLSHKFCSIITPQIARRTVLGKECCQHTNHPFRRCGERHVERQPFTRKLIHHRQDLEWRASGKRVFDKIIGPNLTRACCLQAVSTVNAVAANGEGV